mmetsp:Transcript_12987/g.37022  ORF Transcript_12987/g.37022 Transcript_12987/m.37022 type:complete len:84 (+) Transcript_12987:124-375(+)
MLEAILQLLLGCVTVLMQAHAATGAAAVEGASPGASGGLCEDAGDTAGAAGSEAALTLLAFVLAGLLGRGHRAASSRAAGKDV